MKKVAKLVAVSLMTRVLVNENATEEQIMKVARPRLIRKLNEDGLCDHIESIEDDTEMAFGEGREDIMYQPDFNNPKVMKRLMKGEFNSFDVYRNQANAQLAFPGVKIYSYNEGDIEDPNFVD